MSNKEGMCTWLAVRKPRAIGSLAVYNPFIIVKKFLTAFMIMFPKFGTITFYPPIMDVSAERLHHGMKHRKRFRQKNTRMAPSGELP